MGIVTDTVRLSINIYNSQNEMIQYSGFNANNKSEAINNFIDYVNRSENEIFGIS